MASAAARRPSSAAAVAVLWLLAAAAALAPATASTFTAFSGPGCSGRMRQINYRCGCFSIGGYQGGFDFTFAENQMVYLYTSTNCGGNGTPLGSSTRYCHQTGFRTIRMMCGAEEEAVSAL